MAGIDSSRIMIDEAIARGVPPNAGFFCGSAEALPFPTGSFDAVRAEPGLSARGRPRYGGARDPPRARCGWEWLLVDQDWGRSPSPAANQVTRCIVRTFCDHIANPRAGRSYAAYCAARATNVGIAPLVAMPVLPIAFDLIFKSAMDAAIDAGTLDAETAKRWLLDLLESDQRGEFFCAITVIVALAKV